MCECDCDCDCCCWIVVMLWLWLWLWLKKEEVVRRQRGDDRLRWRWKKTTVSCSATPALASSPYLGFSSHFDRDEMSESRDLTSLCDLIWSDLEIPEHTLPFPHSLLFYYPTSPHNFTSTRRPPFFSIFYFLFSNFTPLFLSFFLSCYRVNILSVFSFSFFSFSCFFFFFLGKHKKIY